MFRPDTARGYRAVFRTDEVNHCPGCGGSQWMVGRLTAECAFCSTAVPLISAGMTGTGLFRASHATPDSLAA
ncbi:MAG TPA: hypothetical protein VM657_07935 [Sphingomonas sp.]|nr:hypothetical protein [Sphingomonas sp.]